VSATEISDFIRSVSGLEDYAMRGVLPPGPEDRWDLYFRIQEAMPELRPYRSRTAKIAVTAEVSSNVAIDDDATICPGATVLGPTLIGRGAFVGNGSLIRPGTLLAPNSIIGNHCHCTASLIGPEAGVFHFCGISRSLLGPSARISVFVATATARHDLAPVAPSSERSDFQREKLGSLVGARTFVAAHVLITPASVIGDDCFIGPFTRVSGEVPDGKYIYVNLPISMRENHYVVSSILPKPSPSFLYEESW
jgi:acetyltransferase-like isoleucine patch superfamily enzyme